MWCGLFVFWLWLLFSERNIVFAVFWFDGLKDCICMRHNIKLDNSSWGKRWNTSTIYVDGFCFFPFSVFSFLFYIFCLLFYVLCIHASEAWCTGATTAVEYAIFREGAHEYKTLLAFLFTFSILDFQLVDYSGYYHIRIIICIKIKINQI